MSTPILTSRICTFAMCLLVIIISSCTDDTSTPLTPAGAAVTGDDTTPPPPVTDAHFTAENDGSISLCWTAPADDDPGEPVAGYEIGYTYVFAGPENFWQIAVRTRLTAAPSQPGAIEVFEFRSVQRGKRIHATVRSIDEQGNVSPTGNIAVFDIPGAQVRATCSDVYTHEPVAGLAVTVTSANGYRYLAATDDNGVFSVADLVSGETNIQISTGTASQTYHRVTTSCILKDDKDVDITMVPYEPGDTPDIGYRSILHAVVHLYATGPLAPGNTRYQPRTHVLYKWPRPLPVYVRQFEKNGTDFHSAALAAIEQWNEGCGSVVFVAVDSPPEVGVSIVWGTRDRAAYSLIEFAGDGLHPKFGAIDFNVDHFTTWNGARHVLLHELGHANRWGHAINNYYLMTGGTNAHSVSVVAGDEARAYRLMEALPDETDLAIYRLDEF